MFFTGKENKNIKIKVKERKEGSTIILIQSNVADSKNCSMDRHDEGDQ